jgi:hypothetical protein
MRRHLIVTWAVCLLAACALAAPKDLSADMVMLEGGKTLSTSKVYISGAKSRMESNMMGGFTSIVRRDRGVVWTLYPERRQYTERPLDAKVAAQDPAVDPPGMISKERAGADNVSGYACTVYRFKVAGPAGRQLTTTGCYSDALGVTLRSEVSGIVTELRNIRAGAQPAGLFEIPAGYQLSSSAVPPNVKLPSNMPPGLAEKMRQAMEQRGGGAGAPRPAGGDPGAFGTLPSWLPAMPGCTPRASGNEQAGGVGLLCQSAAQEMANWYEAALKRNGFTVRQSSITGSRGVVISLKASRGSLEVAGNFSVNVSGQNAGTLSWLTRK